MPNDEHMISLGKLFNTKPENLLKLPSEAWFLEFIDGRTEKEIQGIISTMETGWPRHQPSD